MCEASREDCIFIQSRLGPGEAEQAAIYDEQRDADHDGADDLMRQQRFAEQQDAERDRGEGTSNVTSMTLSGPARPSAEEQDVGEAVDRTPRRPSRA